MQVHHRKVQTDLDGISPSVNRIFACYLIYNMFVVLTIQYFFSLMKILHIILIKILHTYISERCNYPQLPPKSATVFKEPSIYSFITKFYDNISRIFLNVQTYLNARKCVI